MSVVNYETGEVIDFDRAAAERRAQQIETRLTAVGESFTIAMQKIREAIELRDDIALGYRSPGDYVSARFGRALSGLPVEMRREAVRELTEAGMSTRAIAPVVGVTRQQVSKDIRSGGNPVATSQTPEPADVGEADAGSGHSPQGEVSSGKSSPTPAVEPSTPRPAVTGIDGKTYKRPEPAAQPRTAPRRALPDQFFDAAYDLTKAVERVQRLANDDRFPQNAEKVAAKHRNDLLQAIDGLQAVVNRLPSA